jgi:hypothetical protein
VVYLWSVLARRKAGSVLPGGWNAVHGYKAKADKGKGHL